MIPNPASAEKRTVRQSTDRGFRLAIVAVTALGFAVGFGWLACIERLASGEVEFHWQWSAALWIAIGIASPVYFWRQIWPTQPVPPGSARRRQVQGWAALLIPSVMWMAYPLRFVSGQQRLNVLIGLAIAGSVLSLGGWMVFRLIQGFAAEPTPAKPTPATGQPASPPATRK